MKQRIKSLQLFLVVLTLVLVASLTWVYNEFDEVMSLTIKKIEKIELKNIKETSTTVSSFISENIDNNLLKELEKDKELQNRLNSILSKFITGDVKFVYMIYQDKKGSYRYLLDGSHNLNDRGEFKQKFTPASDIWDVCFKKHTDIYTYQKDIDGLWLTYLHPVVKNGIFQGVLAFDISVKTFEEIQKTLYPIFRYFKYIGILIFFILFYIAVEFYMYMQQKKMSYIDPMTHLFNRNYLKDKADNIELDKIAVAIADIDHFKNVNDTYGHRVGDIVIETVAKRILASTRAEDIVIRIGGEEFLILYKKSGENITNVIESVYRLQREVSSKTIRVGELNIPVTISVGFNAKPELSETLGEAIEVADKRLYKAKNSGRNRVVAV